VTTERTGRLGKMASERGRDDGDGGHEGWMREDWVMDYASFDVVAGSRRDGGDDDDGSPRATAEDEDALTSLLEAEGLAGWTKNEEETVSKGFLGKMALEEAMRNAARDAVGPGDRGKGRPGTGEASGSAKKAPPSRGGSVRGGSLRGGSRGGSVRGGSRGGSVHGGSRGGSVRGGSLRGGRTADLNRVCQVDGCKEKRSPHRGADLCEKHRHAESFVVQGVNDGKPLRWCFYCHRAHDLSAFTSASRSICYEKFALRRGRRKAAKQAQSEGKLVDAASPSNDATENEKPTTPKTMNSAGAAPGEGPTVKHISQVVPNGHDNKFWVAHPRELQERMDMWDLVRRLNEMDEPVGMFGTIIPGCVRMTVRGWKSAKRMNERDVLETRLLRDFEGLRLALDEDDVLSQPISISEMTPVRFEPRRVDFVDGQLRRASPSMTTDGALIDAPIFASAAETLQIGAVARDGTEVRLFSEYLDVEDKVSDGQITVDPLASASTTTRWSSEQIIDHILSIQLGGYGAPYEHVAILGDEDIARELKNLDKATVDPSSRLALRDFAMDYVWMSSKIEKATLLEASERATALYVIDSGLKNLRTWGGAPKTCEWMTLLRGEIVELEMQDPDRAVALPLRRLRRDECSTDALDVLPIMLQT